MHYTAYLIAIFQLLPMLLLPSVQSQHLVLHLSIERGIYCLSRSSMGLHSRMRPGSLTNSEPQTGMKQERLAALQYSCVSLSGV
ncbi:hypothetical protein F5Y17DRAFT_415028 [Xylariaceae sp. FL0594]|nr:hypothetical protein F5Y17DRAFT_415028 [Xylariaceae sp. FL0594]